METLEEIHDRFEQEVPQEPPYEHPDIQIAWMHGLVGTAAVNHYISMVYTEDFIETVSG